VLIGIGIEIGIEIGSIGAIFHNDPDPDFDFDFDLDRARRCCTAKTWRICIDVGPPRILGSVSRVN